MRRYRLGTLLICLGMILLFSAGAMAVNNHLTQQQAGESANQILQALPIPSRKPVATTVPGITETTVPTVPDVTEPPQPVLPYIPEYVLNPEIPMPEVVVDGYACIGVLWIPSLDLELPVITETSKKALKLAPCRFSGSAYQNDLVIGAHNYSTHFGKIGDLPYGSAVEFTDLDGNVFLYRVADIEILQPNQAEELCSGQWPLTLYTCTYGGRTRIVVRCERIG